MAFAIELQYKQLIGFSHYLHSQLLEIEIINFSIHMQKGCNRRRPEERFPTCQPQKQRTVDILSMALACPANNSDKKDVPFSLAKEKINIIIETKRSKG